MQKVKHYATEVGLAAALGITMTAIKMNKKQTNIAHPLLDCTVFLKYSPLGQQAIKLESLGDDENFKEMLLCCECFLELIWKIQNNISPTGGQFLVNRLSNNIIQYVNIMCLNAKNSRSNTLIDNLIHCEDDVIPLIKKYCDAELHNMMLKFNREVI